LTLLVAVYDHCKRHGVPAALIGAAAMSTYGIARVTFDADLLTVERAVLQPSFWAEFDVTRVVDIRKGDFDDPLAGVVRISAVGERPIDVVVGRRRFQERAVAQAVPMLLRDGTIPVVQPTDLVLLKLDAGGPQDAWDITQILLSDRTIAARVDEKVRELPRDAQTLWQEIRSR
jgi:hypothetical protein